MKHKFDRFYTALVLGCFLLASSARAQTVYVGNSLILQGFEGADSEPPLVILGEYSPAGPLASATAATTLPTGTVQDVKFYGQNWNFTLYALTLVTNGPSPKEQTFRVVASQSFSNSAASAGIQTLLVSGFSVMAGDLLAFAGLGPYYPQISSDATNSDATYEDSSNPNSNTATPPGGAGTVFSVGIHPDTNANYEYITDAFGNQGRIYAIGVDVSEASQTNQYLPVYQVIQSGATFTQALSLASVLNIPTNKLSYTNGTISYTDPGNFMAIPYITLSNTNDHVISNLVARTVNPYPSNPITLRAIDFATLNNLTVFDTNAAVNVLSNALAAAGLTQQFAIPHFGHTHLLAFMTNIDGTVTSVSKELDTLVNYQFSLLNRTNSYPLIGAGAHVQADFGRTGNVTRLLYAAPQLTSGPPVQIITPLQASNRVANLLPANAQMSMQLVYLAVPSATHAIPYYAYCGTMPATDPVNGSNYTLITETHMIPATDDTNYVPLVSLSASEVGTQIMASVSVTGGTPPYSYLWSGQPTVLASNYGPSIAYTPVIRVGQPALAIAYLRSNATAEVLWPYSAGFVLESSTNLASGNWLPATNAVQTSNAMSFVAVPATGTRLFLRLGLASQTLPVTETLGVTVTDANGVSAHANQTLNAQAVPILISASAPGDPPSYATESPYVGTPWDDAGFTSDTAGWEAAMQSVGFEIFRHISVYSLPGDYMEPELQGTENWLIPDNVPANVTDGEVQPIWQCADVQNQGVNSANLVYYLGHGGADAITFTWPGGNFNTQINNFNGLILGDFQEGGPPPFADTGQFTVCNEFDLPCYSYNADMLGCWGCFPAPWQSQGEPGVPPATNLLWMVFDACDVLVFNSDSFNGFPVVDNNPLHNPIWNTLGPNFNGLHMLLGFNTSAVGGVGTGAIFAQGLGEGSSILQAWFSAVGTTQPSTIPQNSQNIPVGGPIVPAAMGLIGPQGIADFWDVYVQLPGGPTIGPSIQTPTGWWYAWVSL